MVLFLRASNCLRRKINVRLFNETFYAPKKISRKTVSFIVLYWFSYLIASINVMLCFFAWILFASFSRVKINALIITGSLDSCMVHLPQAGNKSTITTTFSISLDAPSLYFLHKYVSLWIVFKISQTYISSYKKDEWNIFFFI